MVNRKHAQAQRSTCEAECKMDRERVDQLGGPSPVAEENRVSLLTCLPACFSCSPCLRAELDSEKGIL